MNLNHWILGSDFEKILYIKLALLAYQVIEKIMI